MKTKFSVGDVVQLNSGGPKMTVIDIQVISQSTSPTGYKTAFFANDRVVAASFPEDALKKGRA